MIGWLNRHTSMRGRLSITLIALLVLPLVAVGADYADRVLRREREHASANAMAANATIQLRMDEALKATDIWLHQILLELRLGAARLVADPEADVERAFEEVGSDARPSLVAIRDGRDWDPPLPEDMRRRLARWIDEGGRRAGYAALPTPEPAGVPSLYQVAIETSADGRRLAVVLHDLSGHAPEGVLAASPFRGPIGRALTFRDVMVGWAGPDDDPASWGRASAALWRRALAAPHDRDLTEVHQDGVHYRASLLPGLDGAPVGLALARGRADRLFPIPDVLAPGGRAAEGAHEAKLRSQLKSLIGWIALAGVLLALGMGLVAPQWIWSDVRDSTDRIFGSVARLRELVRRNARALVEQGQAVTSLLRSVGIVEEASRSIEATTRSLAQSAEHSARVSESGNRTAEVAQRAVLDVRDQVADISNLMEQLGQRCNEIGNILVFIGQIGEGTRKLSVNATIKADDPVTAARQLGFVAGEMRDLAEQALDSTQDIGRRVQEIQKSSTATLDATHAGRREVDRCLDSFEELEQSFARILRWVDETMQFAQRIESSTSSQAESLKSVSESVSALERRTAETEGNFRDIEDAIDELASLGEEMMVHWKVG